MEFSMTVYLDTTIVIDWDHKSAMKKFHSLVYIMMNIIIKKHRCLNILFVWLHTMNVIVFLLFDQGWHHIFFCFTSSICSDFMPPTPTIPWEVREYEISFIFAK